MQVLKELHEFDRMCIIRLLRQVDAETDSPLAGLKSIIDGNLESISTARDIVGENSAKSHIVNN
jgi:hypothetical protein